MKLGLLNYPESYRNLGAFFCCGEMTISREIAILIDGGFFTKRLPKLMKGSAKPDAKTTAFKVRDLCFRHVKHLTGATKDNWHKHVYRIFYYDAHPFKGQAHHPLTKEQINFSNSELAKYQNDLFEHLKKERNLALRLGHVGKQGGWTVDGDRLKKLLATKQMMGIVSNQQVNDDGSITIPSGEVENFQSLAENWAALENWMVHLDLKQKGVDMRIGLDIASLTLKKLASTIVLVAGDADFVPAAKLARREGRQFILDPMRQDIPSDLFEHIDGLYSGLNAYKPKVSKV